MLKATLTPYNLKFKTPGGTSRGVLTHKTGWYISISDENRPQTKGIGECSILPELSPDDQPGLENKLIEVCNNINTITPGFHQTLAPWPAIRFAIEMALLDLENGGRHLFFPSSFTKGEKGIPINGLIWMGTADEMSYRIEEKLKEGFTCLKLKIGAINFNEEYRLLKKLRERFSEYELELRVDANGAFSPEEAPALLERLSQLHLHSIEQPIKAGQWEEMAKLCDASPIPIALDEELIGIHEPLQKARLLETIRPQYIILKPSLTGGFEASRQWINLAEEQNTGWWITSALESNIGLNAIAQWTATFHSNMPQGLGTGGVFTNNTEAPLMIDNGALWYKDKLDFRHYRQLTLSGTPYDTTNLKKLIKSKLAQNDLPNWEHALFHFLDEWLNDNDFVEIKTSGSTGTPKTIRAEKKAMLRSAFNTIGFFQLQKGQSALLCLSCNYIAGKMMVVRALAGGLNLILAPVSSHPLQKINTPIDFAAMTPHQMSNELAAPKPHLHWLKTVILGGAPATRELTKKIQQESFMAWESYGMTETLSHIALKPLNGPIASDWFSPLENTVVSADTRGCCIVETRGITPGPLTTNDLVEFDAEGHFRIKGRIDNIINTGGIKVCPEEVEAKIAHLLPRPFVVVAGKHQTLGQQLILVTEQPINEPQQLLKQIKKLLPPYHAPRKIIVINPLPRTETGKIKRFLSL